MQRKPKTYKKKKNIITEENAERREKVYHLNCLSIINRKRIVIKDENRVVFKWSIAFTREARIKITATDLSHLRSSCKTLSPAA